MSLVACAYGADIEGESSSPAKRLDPLWRRTLPYEPTYILLEPGFGDRPHNAKFQLSVAFQLLGDPLDASPDLAVRPDGLFVAYSQTSFWDLESESEPFYDTSYRPQIFWHQSLPGSVFNSSDLAIEAGYAHESNGQAGADSRALNALFARPLFAWEIGTGFLRVEPRVVLYLNDLPDNPDLPDYRGHLDLTVLGGTTDGWQLRAQARMADVLEYSSLQLDLSHPISDWTGGWLHGYAYLQSYLGYSESLLGYDQRSAQPRLLAGFGITR
ncbi:MAG: phospholipase A [Planctomycetota bacterium]|jgi:phospholipase A1|nr:phospholipase A [Planctomycetota bacterium]